MAAWGTQRKKRTVLSPVTGKATVQSERSENTRDCIENSFQIQPFPHNLSLGKGQEKTLQENVLAFHVIPGVLIFFFLAGVEGCFFIITF